MNGRIQAHVYDLSRHGMKQDSERKYQKKHAKALGKMCDRQKARERAGENVNKEIHEAPRLYANIGSVLIMEYIVLQLYCVNKS